MRNRQVWAQGAIVVVLIVISVIALVVLAWAFPPPPRPDNYGKYVTREYNTLCRHHHQFFTTQDNSYGGASYTLDVGEDGKPIHCDDPNNTITTRRN